MTTKTTSTNNTSTWGQTIYNYSLGPIVNVGTNLGKYTVNKILDGTQLVCDGTQFIYDTGKDCAKKTGQVAQNSLMIGATHVLRRIVTPSVDVSNFVSNHLPKDFDPNKKDFIVALANVAIDHLTPDHVIYFNPEFDPELKEGQKQQTNGIDLNPKHFKPIINQIQKPPLVNPPPQIVVNQIPNPPPVNPPTNTLINKKSDNVSLSKKEAKKYAAENLYPILTNYVRVYWLFTSIMGNSLNKENNQILLQVVDKLKNSGNNFSLKVFKNILKKNNINISIWQKIKLFIGYHIFGFWISPKLVNPICDHGIDYIYDRLFGNNGKNQKNLLVEGSEALSKLFEKYAQILSDYQKTKNSSSLEVSLDEFLKDRIEFDPEINDKNNLCENFSETIINVFLPSLRKDLFQTAIDNVADSIYMDQKRSFLSHVFVFFITFPLQVLKWLGWIINTPIRSFMKRMAQDLGSDIIDNVKQTIQDKNFQKKFHETILELLNDLSNEKPDVNKNPPLPFACYNNSNIHVHLRQLSENLAKILSLKTSDPTVPSTTVENQIKTVNNILGQCGMQPITDQIIGNALKDVIPKACILFLNNYLHPKKFTDELFKKLINTTASAFSPSPIYNEHDHIETKLSLNEVEKKLATKAINTAMKDVIQNTLLPNIPKGYECPIVDENGNKNSTQLDPKEKPVKVFNLNKEIIGSLEPRIREKYIQPGIDMVFDPTLAEYALLHVFKLLSDINAKK